MRIDKHLAEKFGSRTKASEAIGSGRVLVNGKRISPSYEVRDEDKIEIIAADESFVSAGGYKLSKAIKEFGFEVKDKVFADIGASTGGFTDCLLQNGAKKIYCIDVGENQLDKSLICDKTVLIDNFNARYLNRELFSEKLDCVVIDVSFISLTYILNAVSDILAEGATVLALIKPQFECDNRSVGKNGIVKSAEQHKKVITKIIDYSALCGLCAVNITNAPIVAFKNMEYVIQLIKSKTIVSDKNLLLNSVKL